MSDEITNLYTDGAYATHNPSWHAEDASWKAAQIMRVFEPANTTLTVCEVGCGVGGVLAEFDKELTKRGVTARLTGFDIASTAIDKARELWRERPNISFHAVDVLSIDSLPFDLFMFVDVLEHLDQPIDFIAAMRRRGMRRCVVHLPLENYWANIMRGRTDPRVSTVGHVHFFDTHSALSLLERAGLTVEKWVYTPELDLDLMLHKSPRSIAAYIPRKLLFMMAPRLCVHTIGGAAFMAYCTVS